MIRLRLAVGVGGAVGSLGRVGLGELLVGTTSLPVGTLLVNVTGTVALALLGARLRDPVLRAGLLTGALGGWTTVSALAVEVVDGVGGGRAVAAWSYLATTVVAGVLAAWLGQRMTGDAEAVVPATSSTVVADRRHGERGR